MIGRNQVHHNCSEFGLHGENEHSVNISPG